MKRNMFPMWIYYLFISKLLAKLTGPSLGPLFAMEWALYHSERRWLPQHRSTRLHCINGLSVCFLNGFFTLSLMLVNPPSHTIHLPSNLRRPLLICTISPPFKLTVITDRIYRIQAISSTFAWLFAYVWSLYLGPIAIANEKYSPSNAYPSPQPFLH